MSEILSNLNLSDIKRRLNDEINRRSTYTWWDPLTVPSVGIDREPRRVLPADTTTEGQVVTKETYTINNPSDGSLEKTRNKFFTPQGDNPGGQDTDPKNVDNGNPGSSATRVDQDELRNYLLGLSKMHDIDLYYGRDEIAGTMHRNVNDIKIKIAQAESDLLNEPRTSNHLHFDPNRNVKNHKASGYGPYPKNYPAMGTPAYMMLQINRPTMMPSGQRDGEEILPGHSGPDSTNFYDDYGAPVVAANVNQLTTAERKTVPLVNDSYQEPATGASITNGKGNLIDYTGTTTNATATPSGKRPIGWISTPGGAASLTLPGQLFRRSYNGGADRMIPNSNYNGNHPSEVSRASDINPITFPSDSAGDQAELGFHPQNPYVSAETKVTHISQDKNRNETIKEVTEGNKNSVRFGLNPRNPQLGDPYSQASSRQVYGGKVGLCHIACSGLCYLTCDNECSESCQSTCFNRCGDACVASCSNVCTGCSSLCYQSCRTKCQNGTGYSCVNAGAKNVIFSSTGGSGGNFPQNNVSYQTHGCNGCSYSCQFYPNYKTTCTDAMCQNMCFYSCYSYCSTGCYGGCINNKSQHDHGTETIQARNSKDGDGMGLNKVGGTRKTEFNETMGPDPNQKRSGKDSITNRGRYQTGRGQACREGCVADCVGDCASTCLGNCSTSCFGDCKRQCTDTCQATCETTCGNGCDSSCMNSTCSADACAASCSRGCRDNCANDCSGSCENTCSGSCSGINDL